MSDRQTPPADTDLEPIVMFDEDDLIWIITCASPDCDHLIADVRLSSAMRRYREHRDLPAFIPIAQRHIVADDLAV